MAPTDMSLVDELRTRLQQADRVIEQLGFHADEQGLVTVIHDGVLNGLLAEYLATQPTQGGEGE
jgi:hypothetical protein